MSARPSPAQVCWSALALLFAAVAPVQSEEAGGWTLASQNDDLAIYQRPHEGSSLREFKAVGAIAAPPEVVKRVLDDVPEYPKFMPYVVETKVISQDAKSRVSYQRISPPLIGDRDYTVRVKFETRRSPDGVTFVNHWQAANDQGPAEKKGVTRVKITEGYWQLDPIDSGRSTRATYNIFSDSGGSMPAAIVNAGGRSAIPKIFESVRKQSRLEKYSRAQ